MPESEPKPKLIELVAPGAGQGWKAVLKNGKAAVVHEINAPAAEAAAAVPRIQRLAEHRHPALAPVLAWGTEANGLWVAVEPNEGVPLGTILSRGPLTPPAAAALGAALLSGVAALHEAGIAMGGFGAAAIRVTGNGEVRLSGHPAAAVRGAPSQSDLRADVRSCGMAICAAFGVDPAGAPAPPSIPPGLVVTMRSMASGAMGPAADRAQGALREMASALLAPDRATAAQSELALRAGGREMPSITPFLPKETFPPAAPAPTPPQTQAPVPFVPRDETPIRAPASYDPPPRAPESYPTAAPPPVPPPFIPPTRRDEPAPPPPASYEAPPRAPETFPTVAPPIEAPPPPVPTWDQKPQAAQETWGGVPIAPAPEPPAAAPASSAASPADTTWVPAPAPPPAEAPPEPVAPTAEPVAEEPRATWTAVPAPAAVPAEPEPAPITPSPAPTPAAPAPPEPAYVAPSYITPAPAETAAKVPMPATPFEPVPARTPPAPRRPVRDQQPSQRPSWLLPAAVAVVVLILLGIAGAVFLAGRGGNNGNTATSSPGTSPKTSPKATPKTTPSAVGTALQAVPTYAPATSPPFTKVQFCLPAETCQGATSADTNCTLNAACHVDIGIYYDAAVGQITYLVNFFDRCTGTTTVVFKRTDTPNPSFRIFLPAPNGGFPVTLPSAKAGAIVVVAQSGTASAASTPYDLPGSAASCA
jgi:hypothetical protein